MLARYNNGSNSNHDEAMCLMYNHSRSRDQDVLPMTWWHNGGDSTTLIKSLS